MMQNENIDITLEKIQEVLSSYLALSIGNKPFKGKIHIELNCFNGTVGNTSINVLLNLDNKKMDNERKINYTNNKKR